MKQAYILASGGLDSSVLAYYAKKNLKRKIILVFFDYNQKSRKEELFCVKSLARKLNCKLKIIDVKWLGKISTSLINQNKKTGKEEIIKWYVPCRNSLFLISVLAFAESEFIRNKKRGDIFIGIKYEGNLRFKDTTPKFLKEMNKLTEFTEKGKFRVIAPFVDKDKEEIIELGEKLGINLEKTCSCYLGKGFKKNGEKIPVHCGKCAGCKARKKGFKFSNIKDNSLYKN